MAGLLEPYVGNFARASSASSKLDISAILEGCNAVEAETPTIYTLADKMNDCGAYLTKDALSLDGATMMSTVEEQAQGIISVQTNINQAVETIRENAINAYNQLQQQMNEEAYNKEVYEVNRYNASRVR